MKLTQFGLRYCNGVKVISSLVVDVVTDCDRV